MHQKITFILAMLLTALVISGCSNEQKPNDTAAGEQHGDHDDHDHDHHDSHAVPKTFVEAVSQISSLNQQIKSALSVDDVKTADGPVHQIGHILEDVNDMAKEAGLEEADLKEVAASIESLFKAFAVVDERIHTGRGKKYSDVEVEISKAVKVLEAKAEVVSSKKKSAEAEEKE